MDNGRAGLVVLLLRDPHLLERGQRGEDGASDPDGVPANVQCEVFQVMRGYELGFLSNYL